jgi:hypothetical protein
MSCDAKALNLQQILELGSHQTAWAIPHRYRGVMAVPAREKLRERGPVPPAGGRGLPA